MVDYESEIQPVFDRSCSGGACHIGSGTSGVDLSDYTVTMASFGDQYGESVVKPFDVASSPLWLKISQDTPQFGSRMPLAQPPLDDAEIDLIGRWIDQGALSAPVPAVRGDVDRNGTLELTDAVVLLQFLFLGGEAPMCDATADADASEVLEVTDVVAILNYLFRGGAPLPELTAEEVARCTGSNEPPIVEPIGTVQGREGLLLEFAVIAHDPRDDVLSYSIESGPERMTIDSSSGVIRWSPRFGEVGDYRIRVRVLDDGVPPLAEDATGLVRVLEGNHPPSVDPIGTIYAREGVELDFFVIATDPDDDDLVLQALDIPEGSSLDPATGRFTWLPVDGQAGAHPISVRVEDNGTPSRSVVTSGEIICLDADSPVNQPPFIPRRGVYRTYSDRQILFNIGATDPDGDNLVYEAESLPEGATLDTESGEFSWRPGAEQLGPAYVPFVARDDGEPPREIEGLLIFVVHPPGPCEIATCDPELGCTFEARGLDEDCCEGPPEERVAEPVVECPEGRVLHIGGNVIGFGRLSHCDFLAVEPFPQGGAAIRFHVEARCASVEETAVVHTRILVDGDVLLDRTRDVSLHLRTDGFAQRLGIILSVPTGTDVPGLNDRPAMIEVTLTDGDGVVFERRLRVVLTLRDLDDLPEPDTADLPAGEAGCVGCHRPLGPIGERHGIEEAHPWYSLSCTDCHGGDAEADTRFGAHVAPPFGMSYIKSAPADVLDQLDESYIRFINPSDLRVAHRGCGSDSPANPGTGCHQSLVTSVKRSVMSTYAGHYTLPRYLAGSQGRENIFAAIDIENPDFNPATAPEGSVASFSALREPDPLEDRSSAGACIDVYLPKSCPTCHLSDFGPNNAKGNYRSSGCAACHMPYDEDGLSRSDDPAIPKDFPPHPSKHAMTSAIPTEQCAHCHFQGGRIGLAYRGIREGGFGPDQTPENAVPIGRELHNHDSTFYFVDEDDTNDYDETPPDLHADAGLVCGDCHVGGDVHGDGHLYGGERYQVGVLCEDCHGTVRSEIREEDGAYRNSKGFAFERVRRTEDGRFFLKLLADGRDIEIPQIHRILEAGVNQAMIEAMGVNEQGFSHTDSMECYACHTSWRQTCFGCHVEIDDSRSQFNQTTGSVTQGGIDVSRDFYSTDFFALGMNHRGKISPLCSSMSVFLSYKDENGVLQYRDRPRTSSDGRKGFGWNPFHHHTVSRVPQNCDVCHRRAPEAGDDNEEKLRETYGFGTGRFMVTDGDGIEHDVSAFLDEDGELISDFPHANTGPVPREVRERATSIEVVPHPRQER